MRRSRFAPVALAALLALPFHSQPAVAQDAPPHESEGYARPRGAASRPMGPAPARAMGKAAHPAGGVVARSAFAKPAARRGPAVKNDGKRYLRSLDANDDGRITREEFLAGGKKRFAKADTNHDGVISPREGRIAKAKLLRRQARNDARRRALGLPVKPRHKSGRPPKPYLSTFDKNHDGRVSLKEYLERRRKKFDELDLNHDGVISREEAGLAKKKLLRRREERRAEARERRRAARRGHAARDDGRRYLLSLDTNHDGRISRAEYLAVNRKRFAQADTNHDGVISLKEGRIAKTKLLRKQAQSDARRRSRGLPVKVRRKSDRPPKSYLFSFDKNQDGRVTLREYLERRREKFDEMDLNHDGFISREEARLAKMRQLRLREERRIAALERAEAARLGQKKDGPYLHSLDTNHDGNISREEYLAVGEKRFTQIDTNHDGVVSAEEARIAKAKLLRKQAQSDARRRTRGLSVPERHVSDRPGKPYLSSFDANKDGRVSLSEYLERRRKKFDEMDLNHDGVLSSEEARIAKEELLRRREEREARKLEKARADNDAGASPNADGPEPVEPVTPSPVFRSDEPSSSSLHPVPYAAADALKPGGAVLPKDVRVTPTAPTAPVRDESAE